MKKTFCYFLLLAVLALCNHQAFGQYDWTKDANPILSGAGNGTWNKHLFQPIVLFNTDSARFEMWFCGSAYTNDNWEPYKIGFAVSKDNITWTMHSTPVLTGSPGKWDEKSVLVATVIRENGQYKMWYSGWSYAANSYALGYATSLDGIVWQKDTLHNPIFSSGKSAWEAGGITTSAIMKVEGGYKMWYAGLRANSDFERGIGYATSADGIVWQRDTLNNPVLTIGATGQWDDYSIWDQQVLFNDNKYYMWYSGINNNMNGARQVGLATSPDGIVWTKHTANPVVTYSATGLWDANYVQNGTVLLIDDTYHMWYAGSRELTPVNLWRIGHATAPVTGIADNEIEVPQVYILEQNFPNPFNPTTTIEFTLPKPEFVTLTVFNVLGQQVTSLVSEKLNPGLHKYQWQADNLPSGIYYCRMQAGEYEQVRKMILLK